MPGAYQGLWGIRTSHGSIDTHGLLPLAPSFDTVGWLTRDAATLAAVAECLVPEDDSIPDRLVIDPDVCAVADTAIEAATRSAGLALGAEPVDLGADLGTWYAAFRTVQAFEAWEQHGSWISAHPGALETEVAERFAYAATVDAAAAAAARRVLAEASSQVRAVLAGRILVLPSTAALPPSRAIGTADREAARAHTLRLTCLASIAGLPAVTVPMGRLGGVPAGLCLVGPRGTDRSLIRLASSSAAVLAEAPQVQ